MPVLSARGIQVYYNARLNDLPNGDELPCHFRVKRLMCNRSLDQRTDIRRRPHWMEHRPYKKENFHAEDCGGDSTCPLRDDSGDCTQQGGWKVITGGIDRIVAYRTQDDIPYYTSSECQECGRYREDEKIRKRRQHDRDRDRRGGGGGQGGSAGGMRSGKDLDPSPEKRPKTSSGKSATGGTMYDPTRDRRAR